MMMMIMMMTTTEFCDMSCQHPDAFCRECTDDCPCKPRPPPIPTKLPRPRDPNVCTRYVQLNPAIAHLKGLDKIMLSYVFFCQYVNNYETSYLNLNLYVVLTGTGALWRGFTVFFAVAQRWTNCRSIVKDVDESEREKLFNRRTISMLIPKL